jgi:cell division septal protein FtsQ
VIRRRGGDAGERPSGSEAGVPPPPSPPPQVLDELSAAFADDQAAGLPRRGADDTPPGGDTGTEGEPAAVVDQPATDAPASGPTPQPTMSTRAMSADELADAAPAAPPVPAADALVPEATRRSTRRSRREMRKEAKRAARRERHHARLAAKEQRRAERAAGHGKPAPVVDPPGDGADAGESVRIVPVERTSPQPIDPRRGPSGPGRDVASVPVAAPARTVAIIGDDLPDAVYLEGDLGDASGEAATRSRIFIDDRDPTTGTVVSLEVATAAAHMEPRLRERRVAVRRAATRKRVRWALAVTAVVAVAVAVLAVLGSGLFAIDDVSVEGAVYSRGPAFDAVVDDVDGANVLRLDTGALEQRLEAIPWVEDARVTTRFPHGARIEIRERRPMVTYQGADAAYRVLDEHGRVLDVVVGGRPSAYPELLVADGPDLQPGETGPPGYRAAAMLVQSLPAPLRAEVESLSVDAAGTDLRADLASGVEVRFGAAQDLMDKIVRLQVALTNPDPDESAPTQLIDVSTDDVILR